MAGLSDWRFSRCRNLGRTVDWPALYCLSRIESLIESSQELHPVWVLLNCAFDIAHRVTGYSILGWLQSK
jgi:hypothetical protein